MNHSDTVIKIQKIAWAPAHGTNKLKHIYPRSIPCHYNVENTYYVTPKSTNISPTNGGKVFLQRKSRSFMLHLLLINDCSFSCRMKEASNIMNATNEGLQH